MNQKMITRVGVRLLLGILLFAAQMPGAAGAAIDSPQSPQRAGQPAALRQSASDGTWPMAGANPQRTSWTSEQVPSAAYMAAHRNESNNGKLYPQWYRPIEPYISEKIQVIAANGLLYVSTARGLYALDASNGAQKWVYPTEMPLGHSPTIYNGVAYVGGFDHKLHAIAADPDVSTLPLARDSQGRDVRINTKVLWTFEATQGFDTNPLVVNDIVYAGNRDGYMYAVYSNDHPKRGQLAWKFKTDGPIHFSAAASNDQQTIYFAADDSYAYALAAQTGVLIWKSQKLPGAGFHSFWPVVYTNSQNNLDYVVLTGSMNYRGIYQSGAQNSLLWHERDDIYPNRATDPPGTLVGPRDPGTKLINSARVAEYFEQPSAQEAQSDPTGSARQLHKPWRRTYLVLDQATGAEVTYDFDGDGKREYAPILYTGTHAGNRFPPVVGADGNLYQKLNYASNPWIPQGQVGGWLPGTRYISTPSSRMLALDEPQGYAIGGNILYWSLTGDQEIGGFDLSVPNNRFWDSGVDPGVDATREWAHWATWGGTPDPRTPNYAVMFQPTAGDWGASYGGQNGVYGNGGDQNPPIPYQGQVFIIKSNSVIAFGPQDKPTVEVPLAGWVAGQGVPAQPTTEELKQRLALEVQKMLDAGHLRPGYSAFSGLFDIQARELCGDHLSDHWHNPSDTLYTLIRALPHLSPSQQQATRAYLQAEFAAYPPYNVIHMGLRDGAAREVFDLPPEIDADRANWPPSIWMNYNFVGWGGADQNAKYPPHMFYALWKYAQLFGGAKQIFDASKDKLEPVPSTSILLKMPFVHNAYIAGYLGYLELQKLAGYPASASVKTQLDNLVSSRASTFSMTSPYPTTAGPVPETYCRALNVAGNFMFLVPELRELMTQRGVLSTFIPKVEEAVAEYQRVAPYWFVARFEQTIDEGSYEPYFDVHALFQAKSLLLNAPRAELAKYLDIPAYARGDLFYTQNLVAVIEAESAALETVALPLRSGWNLVALPLAPIDSSPTAVFASIAGQLVSAYRYDGCDSLDPWKRYDPAAPAPMNDLTTLDARAGLWIETRSDVTLPVTGSLPSGTTISLCQGANLIGYPSSSTVSLPGALASISGSYDKIYAYDQSDTTDPWKTFDPTAPSMVNDLTALGPGRGYWLNVTAAGVLQVTP